MILKKEGRKKIENERGRQTNKQEMRVVGEKWTRGLHIDTIGEEIITRVSE